MRAKERWSWEEKWGSWEGEGVGDGWLKWAGINGIWREDMVTKRNRGQLKR